MRLDLATDADIAAVAGLVNAAYRGEDAGWTHERDWLDGLRTSVEDLRRDLAARPEARLLTLRDGSGKSLQGCVWLEPAGDDVWYLGMLTVRPDLQDRKLGRGLLEAAEAYAAGLGARRIRMTVVNVRGELIAWYERRGYALTGETLPFPYEDDPFGAPTRPDLSFVVLERTLSSPG